MQSDILKLQHYGKYVKVPINMLNALHIRYSSEVTKKPSIRLAGAYLRRHDIVMWPYAFGFLQFDLMTYVYAIDLLHKSHNAPVPYHIMHHSEQRCLFLCWMVHCRIWNWCIVRFVKRVHYSFIPSISVTTKGPCQRTVEYEYKQLLLIRQWFQCVGLLT